MEWMKWLPYTRNHHHGNHHHDNHHYDSTLLLPFVDSQHAARIAAMWDIMNTTTTTTISTTTDQATSSSITTSLFVPLSFLWNHVICSIVITFVLVSLLYYMLLQHFTTILNIILYLYPPATTKKSLPPSSSSSTTTLSSSEENNHYNHNRSSSNKTNGNCSNNNHSYGTKTNHETNHHVHKSSSISSSPSSSSLSQPLLPPPSSLLPPPFNFTTAERQKLCYQMTNCLVNICLSSLGLYYEYFYQNPYQTQPSDNTNNDTTTTPTTITPTINTIPAVEETIRGYNAFVYMSAIQMGYQLWAIPIGIRLHESIPMILHHMTVICCAGMSGCLQYGFRYYTPFFYGIVELSSIPLAIMNAFRDHPSTLQYYYPQTNATVRYLFAALFLYIRIVLFLPKKYCFVRDHILLWTSIRTTTNTSTGGDVTTPITNHTTTIVLYQCFMAMVSFSAFFLLVLQIYWATLILKGLFKIFFTVLSPPRQRRTTTMETTNHVKTT